MKLKSGKKKEKIRIFFLWKKYEKHMNGIFGDLCFFYDLFMICFRCLGFPLFFIDFPKEFLEIFDFSLIFLEFFVSPVCMCIYIYMLAFWYHSGSCVAR